MGRKKRAIEVPPPPSPPSHPSPVDNEQDDYYEAEAQLLVNVDVGPSACNKKAKADVPEFETLAQFIAFIEENELYDLYENMASIVPVLYKLDAFVGMTELKNSVIDQVMFSVQHLDDRNNGMQNVVISGNPGVGKSEVAKVLAELYHAMGLLETDEFHIATRDMLIGKFLGSTSIKTKNVLMAAKGGVIFIDEAYSLGNVEKRDSFSKECIDAICGFLSENFDTIMIIAGYDQALRDCFFSYNSGLERRFPYRFHIGDYKPAELRDIFLRQVERDGWAIDDDAAPLEVFVEKKQFFEYNGGCTQNLLMKAKLAHARRVFGVFTFDRKVLNKDDFAAGMKAHIAHYGADNDGWDKVSHIYM